MRMGGFGCDAVAIAPCARLATIVNVSETAVEMGASEAHLAWGLEKAVSRCMDYLNLTIRPELTPSKELQKHLTAALRARTSDTLVRSADPW